MSLLATAGVFRPNLDSRRLPLSVALLGVVLVMNVVAAVLSLMAA